MPGIDLSNVLDTMTAVNSATTQDTNNLALMYGQEKGIETGMQSAITTEGASAQIVQGAKLAGALQTQTNIRAGASALGTNMDDASEIVTSLSSQADAFYSKSQQQLAGIQQKQSVGLLDNPLQWLSNQLTLPGDQEDLETTTMQQHMAETRLNTILTETQEVARTENAISLQSTAATNDATLTGLAAQTSEKLLATQQENLKFNIDATKSLNQARQEVLQNLFTGVQLQNAQQEFAFKQQLFPLQVQEANDRHTLLQEEVAKNEADLASKQDWMDKYNAGASTVGLPPLKGMKEAEVVLHLPSTDPRAQMARLAYQAGSSAAANGGTPIIGASPIEAGKSIALSGAPMPGMNPVIRDLLSNTYAESKAGQIPIASPKGGNVPVDPKNENQVLRAGQQYIAGKLQNYSRVVDPLDRSNPYNIPPLANVISVPAVAATPLFSEVLRPAIESGALQNPSAAQIISLTQANIKAGKIDFATAASNLATYFNAGVAQNNIRNQWDRIGQPQQSSYNVRITADLPSAYTLETGGRSQGTTVLDLTNKTNISRALMLGDIVQ